MITASTGQVSVFAADLDGDGDLDVISAACCEPDGAIGWNENTDGLGSFGPYQTIATSGGVDASGGLFAADLDRDGDQDVLSGSLSTFAWYENTDGMGTFGPRQVISRPASLVFFLSVFAADLDGDGDFDVLSAANREDRIAWYENLTPRLNAVLHWEFYE